MHVLLTGGSGFIAAHVLNSLLERGHSVVTTVRSQDKFDRLKAGHPDVGKDRLDFAIVKDIAQPGSFDEAVQFRRPFDAVIHTASPLNLSIKDVQTEVLDPAIIGTTGILASVARYAPSVKRVVVLSSFAAMSNIPKGDWPGHTYTAADWNPITHEEALVDAVAGYRGSKTFAERAAWDFMEREKPSFTLTTLNPPFVFGPVVPYPGLALDALNASNRRFVGFVNGVLSPTGFYAWVDVRDCALGHALAMEDETAAGERILFTAPKQFSNEQILNIIHDEFPDLRDRLPAKETWSSVGFPEGGVYGLDASRAEKLLGREFVELRKCVVDTVGMIKGFL